MTVKSNFKLDDRIKSIDDIQTILCNNNDFVGCEGYFFDEFVQTKNLTKLDYGTLVDIDIKDSDDHCFKARDEKGNERIGYYRFFVPEKLLKPIKKIYRPFSIEEFLKIFAVGDLIEFRSKDNDEVKHAQFIGYVEDDAMIGIYRFSLSYLFENYELFFDGSWQSFGVLVEEE